MDNENEFELGGVAFTAKAVSAGEDCDGCHLNDGECWVYIRPCCTPAFRRDGLNVIFVEDHP